MTASILRLGVAICALACAPVAAHAQSGAPSPSASLTAPALSADGSHDFDFTFGSWRTHTSHLRHPLSGSADWSESDSTTVVHPIWAGKANIAEIDANDGSLHVIALRLYNPTTHEWSITFANGNVGQRSVPLIGHFANGRGVFYDQEDYNGRTILVRFTFMGISSERIETEQAFSADGGVTWETNSRSEFTRVRS